MSIWLKLFDRCGQPIFIVLAFLTLPFWFPLLWVWVVIDPPYRMAMWRKKHLKPSIEPIGRTSIPSFDGKRFSTPDNRSKKVEISVKPPTKGNKES